MWHTKYEKFNNKNYSQNSFYYWAHQNLVGKVYTYGERVYEEGFVNTPKSLALEKINTDIGYLFDN